MTEWTNEHTLGLIPAIICAEDSRPVKEQIKTGYAHGGGYNPMSGFILVHKEGGTATLRYPGDPAFKEWGRAQIGEELVIVFDCGFVAIVQSDNTFEVTRMD